MKYKKHVLEAKITPELCIASNTCWPEDRIKKYKDKKNPEGYVWKILDDDNVSIVDKIFIVDISGILSDRQKHKLALEFASHVLTKTNRRAWIALAKKEDWLDKRVSDSQLAKAETMAWEEAKTLPKSKAAAFAAKRDARLAFNGSASFSGGWYGGDVDPKEKRWQWNQILKEITE